MGKRYNEDVDTFSFGAVLYEIAVRNVPYGDEIAELKKQKRGGGVKKLMREVATGARRPELAGVKGLRKFHVGSAFKNCGLMRDVCNDLNPMSQPNFQFSESAQTVRQIRAEGAPGDGGCCPQVGRDD